MFEARGSILKGITGNVSFTVIFFFLFKRSPYFLITSCILPLMKFFINNLAYFSLNSEIYNKFTRYKMCLIVLQVNLSLYQEGVLYITIKFFNSLPKCKADLVQNKKKLMGKLKSVLMKQSLYLVNNFLDYCGGEIERA